MSEAASPHPEVATMVAFVEGKLPPGELAAVGGHLRDCAECRLVVTETARFEREDDARPRRVMWRGLAAAAAAVAVVAVTVPLLNRQTAPLARLIEQSPDHRRVEGRLSGFPWAELRPPSRGAGDHPADLRLAGAAGEVLEETAGKTSPEARHAAGVAYLLSNQRAQSVMVLEEAARTSKDARVWNDLAAARLALVVLDGRATQLPLALADVDRALALDPRLPEARFNRALILERLGVREQARKAWLEFLAIDADSGWSVEARARLRKLEQAGDARFDPRSFESTPPAELVRRFPQEARTRGEGLLLAEWADAYAAGDAKRAEARLSLARAIGRALAAHSGEELLRDAVAAIDGADEVTRGILAHGHRLYRDGRVAFSRRLDAEAVRSLRAASRELERGRSPMAHVAAAFAASAALNPEGAERVREELQALQSRLRKGYRALEAETRWTLMLQANTTGDWGRAVREGDAAARTFHDLGERSNAATVDATVAYSLDVVGENDLAWNRRLRAIEGLCGGSDEERCRQALRNAAFTLTSRGRPAGGVALMDLTMAGDAGAQPLFLARAFSDRARAAGLLNDPAAASRWIERAREAAARIADPAARTAEEIQLELAHAVATHAPARAFDRAAAFYAERKMPRFLVDVLLQRARAHRRDGNSAAAAADHDAALRTIGAEQSTIGEPALRLAFLDTAAQVFEDAIDLRIERGDAAGAFAVARRRHGEGAGLAGIPEGVAAIEYAVLPQRLVVFLATKDGLRAETVPVPRDELVSRVERFAAKLRDRADARADAAAMYALLIEPVAPRLAGIGELVVVPDQQLHALPFAALFDPSRGRYLIEDYTLRVATAGPAATAEEHGELSPALVVADPPAAGKPRLESSREEAAHIARLHGATLLVGADATRSRFIEAASNSALIHYAGHADSDAVSAFGALLLAGEGGVLGSSDIRRLSLRRRPLVVLGACGTVRGSATHVAGMASIARAFLLAGARGVVGTLWEIDDDVAAALFSRFHQNLRAGASPARALRDAQVDMLRSGEPRLQSAGSWAVAELLSKH